MEVTKREIIVSISIISLMFILGLFISGNIENGAIDEKEKYNKAIQIESKELFEYGMKTNVGNAFIYGDLEITDPVTYKEIGGQYSYIKKVKEVYTMHTRTVCETVGSGKNKRTVCHEEVYWSWDTVKTESKKSKDALFLGVKFKYSQFSTLPSKYIKTIKESSHVRYKYYGSPIKSNGTIFATLKDNNIGEEVPFYKDKKIDEAYEMLTNDLESGVFIFWIIWILITSLCICTYCYFDNDYLY